MREYTYNIYDEHFLYAKHYKYVMMLICDTIADRLYLTIHTKLHPERDPQSTVLAEKPTAAQGTACLS
jgi:hypothetical protein